MKIYLWLFLSLLSISASAQNNYPDNPHRASNSNNRINSLMRKTALKDSSKTLGIDWVNIGPTVMGGRVSDIDVDPDDATHFYVAYASGGLWETVNNGTTFEPVFDNNGQTLTIGDFAVNWETKEIWVGTGEANSSRSSYAGYGIYYSSDAGESWQFKGLGESHHIGKIIIHPVEPGTIYVAVLGHLYSPNKDRGVYKTTDTGKTWEKVLYIDENTGVVDLILDIENPEMLYAATWEKSRRAWNLWESGKGSGIFKTSDGGKNWSFISGNNSGFPSGDHVGRIGLALYSNGNQSALYAIVDNQSRHRNEADKVKGFSKKNFIGMSVDTFLYIPDSILNDFLTENTFPEKYRANSVKKMVRKNKIVPEDLYKYLTDENKALFDDPVRGAELYRSNDGGITWNKTHEKILDKLCYSYGYYFGTINVDPTNPERIFIAGVPLLMSENGGKTFTFIGSENVHVDHHRIWVDPDDSGHLINGNDGGINISYDFGKSWIKCNSPAVGQFYSVTVETGKNYSVYGGMQDNGTWKGPFYYKHSASWHQTGNYPYKMLNGGDGMHVQIDESAGYLYTGYQFGHYVRISSKSGKRMNIHPHHELGQEPFRWNWQTPIWLSTHNNKVLYMGSNKFHKSSDRGESFKTMITDLTKGGQKGDVSFGTLTSIHESPLKFGMIAVGSDDGLIHVSRDGGKNWINVSKGLPSDMWVSRVVYSSHETERLYVCLNGYRWDVFESFIYVSENNGETWRRIGTNLPYEPVNVLREDPSVENLLFVGTDNGVYVSHDLGITFSVLGNSLPPVAVHDIAIQDKMSHCVIGTHGRSLYRLDISGIRIMDTLSVDGFVFAPRPIRYNKNWGDLQFNWSYIEGSITFNFIVFNSPYFGDSVMVDIIDDQGRTINQFKSSISTGHNVFNYNLTVREETAKSLGLSVKENGEYYITPGNYTFRIKTSTDQFISESFKIIEIKR